MVIVSECKQTADREDISELAQRRKFNSTRAGKSQNSKDLMPEPQIVSEFKHEKDDIQNLPKYEESPNGATVEKHNKSTPMRLRGDALKNDQMQGTTIRLLE